MLGFGRIFVDDLVVGWDDEYGGGGFVALDVADCDELLAGARIVVFDDHVDRKLGRVPVLIDNGDILAGGAHGRGDDVGLADAGEGEAVERLGADVFHKDWVQHHLESVTNVARCFSSETREAIV